MTNDQREILTRYGVDHPDKLDWRAKLDFANAPSEAEVLDRSKTEATSSFNTAADTGDFGLDNAKMIAAGYSPLVRLQICESWESVAIERKRRSAGQHPQISDDAYFGELASRRSVTNDYTAQVIDRMLKSAGRAQE